MNFSEIFNGRYYTDAISNILEKDERFAFIYLFWFIIYSYSALNKCIKLRVNENLTSIILELPYGNCQTFIQDTANEWKLLSQTSSLLW